MRASAAIALALAACASAMKLATRSVAAPTRRTALLSTAALALARAPAASAQALARSVEQKIAVVNVDGTTSTTTATRLTGELTGLDLSNRRDITERVFGDAIRADWPAAAPDAPPWKPRDFRRLDESDDAAFYAASEPRFVYHIDEGAVAALTNYYKAEIPAGADVLDICSSWVSHYPINTKYGKVVGTGMNAKELAANTQLTDYVQRDLNKEPTLPFADRSFDVVTCVVSVDYLTQPLAVLAEVRRVLRPGGKVIFSQSNRMFMTKAVGMWVSMGDEAHLELIGQYLKYAGFSTPPKAYDISAKGRGARDPMYIVQATA
ncbi:hypothetical protein SO694_00018496 [Aureococcus anophagefferens]|uniref:Methyltransferase type 11 domain-containing protein n=2 Tax=Aureococcus anophagefferens TaxID=44056 RepID=A0ABR1G0W0_AURAN